jgi:hypothetical protein
MRPYRLQPSTIANSPAGFPQPGCNVSYFGVSMPNCPVWPAITEMFSAFFVRNQKRKNPTVDCADFALINTNKK